MTGSLDALRDSGIKPLGRVPWGTHLCQFYATKEDLIEILVPYFAQGLKDGEFCVWVTSPPLEAEEAKVALERAVPNLDEYLKKGQIEILPYTEWYLKDSAFDSDRVLNGWAEKETAALNRGFQGLRLTGNTFWVERNHWGAFVNYEEEINRVIGQHRMLALCTYALGRCNGNDIVDVIRNHESALIKKDDWVLVEDAIRRREAQETTIYQARLVNSVSDAIISGDAERRVTFWNPAAERLYGWKAEEVLGRNLQDLMHSEYQGVGHKEMHQILNERGEWRGEVLQHRKDGTPIWVESYRIQLRDADGKETGYVTVNRDITERKKAEEDISYQARLINSVSDAIIASDSQLHVTSWNTGAEKIYGWKKEEVLGKSLAELTRPQYLGIDRAEMLKALDDAGEWRGEVIQHGKDGRPIFLESNRILLRDDRGKTVGYVAVNRDITQRMQMQEKVESLARFPTENPNPIVRVGSDGSFLYGNAASTGFLQLLGCEIGGHLPMSWQSYINEALKAKSNRTLEVELSDRAFSVVITPFPDRNYANIYAVDITERRKLEHEREQREKFVRSILDSFPGVVFVFDHLRMKNVFVSRQVWEMIGYDMGEVEGMSESFWEGKSHPDDMPQILAFLNRVTLAKDGEILETEYRLLHRNGMWRWFRARHVVLTRTSDGKVEQSLGIAEDITERKGLEEMKNLFISDITHELRTPLISIVGYTDFLLNMTKEGLSDDARSSLQIVKRNADRLLSLTNQLLDFRRLVDGRLPINFISMDLREIIGECVEDARPMVESKMQQLVYEPYNAPLLVQGDAMRLSQVVANLLSNASKYTPEGGKITLSMTDSAETVEVRVVDTGIGIKTENLSRIFEPFSRVANTGAGGVGLGLSIAKSLVEAHGGKLWAESPGEGKGSMFFFTLPKKKEQ